jgi:hypothetical protein
LSEWLIFFGVPQTKIPEAFLFSTVYARCPPLIVVLNLITGTIRLRARFPEFQRDTERERETEIEKEKEQLDDSRHGGTCRV